MTETLQREDVPAAAPPPAGTAILEMRGIRKTFPGVVALDKVDLTVRAGEIHAIVGENGAGKSTLMKVLSGVYPHGSYEGEIRFEGQAREFKGIADSEHIGIIIIHQELALVPLLSIAENIFLGNEPQRFGVIDWAEGTRRARELLAKVGLKESPSTLITNLGVGKQQLVEIAKALAKRVRLLILDEPTASLNEHDSMALLDLLLEFKAQGIACILISHKLNEISRVADAITVLRDGSSVQSLDCKAETISEDQIIRAMVGRELADRYPPRARLAPEAGETVFEIRDWHVAHPVHADRDVVKGVTLKVKRGEIVGIAGLMGAGRTELAMSVFGRAYGQRIRGEVLMHGKTIDVSTIQKAIGHGIAYVTGRPQEPRLAAGGRHSPQHQPGQPEGGVARRRDRRRRGVRRRGRLPSQAQHPLRQRDAADGQSLGRQPAEGGAGQVAVLEARAADPGRAHTRHRRGRQVRDLFDHGGAGGRGQVHPDDLLRDA